MQTQDAKEVITHYLSDSAKHGEFTAQPGTVSILKEHKLAESIIYIVSYIAAQQQLYACISLRQSETGSLTFNGFMMMGGCLISDFSEKLSPQIAYVQSSSPHSSFVALAIMQNEEQVTAARIRDNHGYVARSQLENSAALFLASQQIHRPLGVELLDDENNVVLQKTLGELRPPIRHE